MCAQKTGIVLYREGQKKTKHDDDKKPGMRYIEFPNCGQKHQMNVILCRSAQINLKKDNT